MSLLIFFVSITIKNIVKNTIKKLNVGSLQDKNAKSPMDKLVSNIFKKLIVNFFFKSCLIRIILKTIAIIAMIIFSLPNNKLKTKHIINITMNRNINFSKVLVFILSQELVSIIIEF